MPSRFKNRIRIAKRPAPIYSLVTFSWICTAVAGAPIAISELVIETEAPKSESAPGKRNMFF
jgi:hypothetical protein